MKREIELVSCFKGKFKVADYHLLSRSELFRDLLDSGDYNDSESTTTIETTESNKQLSDYIHLLETTNLPDNLLLLTDLLVLTDKYKDVTSTKLIENYLLINCDKFDKLELYSLSCRFQLDSLRSHQLNIIDKDDLAELSTHTATFLGSADLYHLIKHSHKDRKFEDSQETIQQNFDNYRSMY